MRETVNDALVKLVSALGGSKQVGPVLWPEKTIDAAQKFLMDCLNEERPARLSPEHLVTLLRMGRDKGVHVVMEYLCEELDYHPPVAMVREIDLDEALRRYDETTDRLVAVQEQIKQLFASQRAQSHTRSVRA